MNLFQFNSVFHLVPRRENGPKTCLAAHHVFVGFGRVLQREDFIHRAHAGEQAESKRILRIDRAACTSSVFRRTTAIPSSTDIAVSPYSGFPSCTLDCIFHNSPEHGRHGTDGFVCFGNRAVALSNPARLVVRKATSCPTRPATRAPSVVGLCRSSGSIASVGYLPADFRKSKLP